MFGLYLETSYQYMHIQDETKLKQNILNRNTEIWGKLGNGILLPFDKAPSHFRNLQKIVVIDEGSRYPLWVQVFVLYHPIEKVAISATWSV